MSNVTNTTTDRRHTERCDPCHVLTVQERDGAWHGGIIEGRVEPAKGLVELRPGLSRLEHWSTMVHHLGHLYLGTECMASGSDDLEYDLDHFGNVVHALLEALCRLHGSGPGAEEDPLTLADDEVLKQVRGLLR